MKNSEKHDQNATEMRPSFISDHSGGVNKMVDHVAEVGNMAQLTIEQMRDMGGKPYWHVGLRKDSKPPHWAIMDPMIAKNIDDYFYGERWIAYAYPPAHIDLEAWEPCGEMCRNNCATCDHNADELFGDADYCKDCHRYSKWESSIHKYCERCDRPRTPEARAMLEKRLRGVMICRCGI